MLLNLKAPLEIDVMEFSGGQESASHPRGHRFDPWPRVIPHATELSLCATATDPALQSLSHNCCIPCPLEPVLHTKRSPCDEQPVHNHSTMRISEDPTQPEEYTS